jgi:RNA recognition motif-containing protein
MAMSGDSPPPPPAPPETSDSELGPESKTKLYVGNISYSWTDKDLHELFDPFGTVVSVRIPVDDRKQSRGFGFVEFATEEEAAKAVAELDNKQFGGRTLKVNISVPRPRGADSYDRRGGDGYGRERDRYRDEGGGYDAYAGYAGYGGYAGGYDDGRYGGYDDYRRERGDYRGRYFPDREYGARDPRDFR